MISVTDLKSKCGFSRKKKIGHCEGKHEEGSTHEERFSCPAGYSFQDNIGGEECTLGIPAPAALAMGRKVILTLHMFLSDFVQKVYRVYGNGVTAHG